MKMPGPLRRFYRNHETLAKVSGVFIFLVIIVVLYVSVFRTPQVTSLPGVPTPTPTPSPTFTPGPTSPPVIDTPPPPPFPVGPYQTTIQKNIGYGAVLD